MSKVTRISRALIIALVARLQRNLSSTPQHLIGIVWSPSHKPIIMAIYTYRQHPDDKPSDKVISDITQVIMKQGMI